MNRDEFQARALDRKIVRPAANGKHKTMGRIGPFFPPPISNSIFAKVFAAGLISFRDSPAAPRAAGRFARVARSVSGMEMSYNIS
jgi:hypothetical protein